MIIGKIQKLKVDKIKEFGVYLSDLERTENDATVLLPKKQVPIATQVGDELEVFVYRDSEDRPIATTRKPLLQAGEIGQVQVTDLVPSLGAFIDIGLERDVLLPYREQRYDIKKGDLIEVYLYTDKSGRLAATMYTKSHKENAVVKDKKEIKTFRYEHDSEKVYKILKEKFKGKLPYTDKTVTPAQIEDDFFMSKAAFKRAIGKLLKEGKIKITNTGIFCIY